MNFSLLLSIFLVLLPTFGVVLEYGESIIFYGGVILFLFCSKWAYSYKQGTPFLHKYRIILFLLAIISVLSSKNISFSYYSLINLIFIFTLLDLALRHTKAKTIYKYLLYSSLLYSIIFILNKIGIIPLYRDSKGDNFILQIWGHSYLALLLVFPIVSILYQIISGKKVYPYSKFIIYLLFIFLFICLFLTHSRSAFITVFISGVYIIITLLKSIKLKIFYVVLATLLACSIYFILSRGPLRAFDGSRLEYWSEAYQAFINRPLLGQGPGNFFYINKLFQNKAFTNTNYAFNSVLQFLSTYGVIFSSLFFVLVFGALIYQKKHSPLNFILGFTGITNSLFDVSWDNFGIFCLSLFFIFYNYPKLYIKKKSVTKNPSVLKYFLLLFFLSKLFSDFAFINDYYLISIYFDPFNPNARKELINQGKYLESNEIFLKNYYFMYKLLVNKKTPNESNLLFFHKIIDLGPRESITEYTKLSVYYYQNKDFEKLRNILDKASKYIDVSNFDISETMNIAKINYYLSINYWNESKFDMAIDYLKKATYFSQGWSHFQIELANAYWHMGQKDQAINQLTIECQKSSKSIPHCQQYLDENKDNFIRPGDLKMFKEIEAINPYSIY